MTTPGAPEATMTPEHRSHFEKWCEDHQWTARLTLLGVIQAYRDFCKAEASALRRAAEARDERQCKVSEWCAAAFGADHANSVPQRAVRLLEEAIEAYQAAGADPVMAHKLIDFVFSRPAGSLAQEIGDVGLTLLAIAARTTGFDRIGRRHRCAGPGNRDDCRQVMMWERRLAQGIEARMVETPSAASMRSTRARSLGEAMRHYLMKGGPDNG